MAADHVFKLVSPSLLHKQTKRLDFQNEAALYIDRLAQNRSSEDLAIIKKIRSKIAFTRRTSTITAIPAHVEETLLIGTLRSYASLKSHLKTHHVVIFLNADKRTSRSRYAKSLRVQLREIANFKKQFPQLRLSVVNHRFSSFSMGRLRGLLTDAIVGAAVDAHLSNPLLISNDADVVALPFDYLKRIQATFKMRPQLDAVQGFIFWGQEHREADGRVPRRLLYPELFLTAEYWVNREKHRRDLMIGRGRKSKHGCLRPLSGANSVFRLASYCAIGGYDFKFYQAEDCDFGWNLQQVRKDIFCDGRGDRVRKYVDFAPHIFLTTSPRRAFHTILTGKTFTDQWKDFVRTPGVKLDIETLRAEYLKTAALLQWYDIEAARAGDVGAIKKIKTRVKELFFRTVRNDPMMNSKERVEDMAKYFGLAFDARKNIRWPKSSILRSLIGAGAK